MKKIARLVVIACSAGILLSSLTACELGGAGEKEWAKSCDAFHASMTAKHQLHAQRMAALGLNSGGLQ